MAESGGGPPSAVGQEVNTAESHMDTDRLTEGGKTVDGPAGDVQTNTDTKADVKTEEPSHLATGDQGAVGGDKPRSETDRSDERTNDSTNEATETAEKQEKQQPDKATESEDASEKTSDQQSDARVDDKNMAGESQDKGTAADSEAENKEHSGEEAETSKEEEYTDILGNGTLLKKVLIKGSGRRPNMQEKVTIKVQYEIPELDKSLPEETLVYVLGEGDVVQALDLAVALMNIGETAQVVAGFRYMYGEIGLSPDVPPNANFKLTVQLISSEVWDYAALSAAEKLAEAKKKKERGNFLFRRKEYERAVHSYTLADKIVDPSMGNSYSDETAENLQEILEFRAIVLCNSAAALFKLEAYEGAANSAKECVKLSPSYAKGHVRLGQAQEKLGLTDEAIKSYKLALKNDAENAKWLHGELARLSKVNKQSKENQQQMYSKMFWGSNPPTVNDSTAKPASSSNSNIPSASGSGTQSDKITADAADLGIIPPGLNCPSMVNEVVRLFQMYEDLIKSGVDDAEATRILEENMNPEVENEIKRCIQEQMADTSSAISVGEETNKPFSEEKPQVSKCQGAEMPHAKTEPVEAAHLQTQAHTANIEMTSKNAGLPKHELDAISSSDKPNAMKASGCVSAALDLPSSKTDAHQYAESLLKSKSESSCHEEMKKMKDEESQAKESAKQEKNAEIQKLAAQNLSVDEKLNIELRAAEASKVKIDKDVAKLKEQACGQKEIIMPDKIGSCDKALEKSLKKEIIEKADTNTESLKSTHRSASCGKSEESHTAEGTSAKGGIAAASELPSTKADASLQAELHQISNEGSSCHSSYPYPEDEVPIFTEEMNERAHFARLYDHHRGMTIVTQNVQMTENLAEARELVMQKLALEEKLRKDIMAAKAQVDRMNEEKKEMEEEERKAKEAAMQEKMAEIQELAAQNASLELLKNEIRAPDEDKAKIDKDIVKLKAQASNLKENSEEALKGNLKQEIITEQANEEIRNEVAKAKQKKSVKFSEPVLSRILPAPEDEGTDVDSVFGTVVEDNNDTQKESPKQKMVSRLLYSFVGAGLVASVGIGIYRYLNH